MPASVLFASVLESALAELRAATVPVFTFAFYHDHESEAVSVGVDTEENSARRVLATNRYGTKHFRKAIEANDLAAAGLWQANIGRNLSLGDFARINLARADLDGVRVDGQFYLTMIRSVMTVQDRVATLSPEPGRLLFACSGPNADVAYVWSMPSEG